MNVKYLRKPRGHNKAYVYQRKVPKHLQKYDKRKTIEEPLGTTEAVAVEVYPRVHAKIEAKFKHYKALYRNGNNAQPPLDGREETEQLLNFIKTLDGTTFGYFQHAVIGILSAHREEVISLTHLIKKNVEVSRLVNSYHKKETDNA